MKFKLLENEIHVQDIEYEKSTLSPHTQKELECIYIEFKIIGKSRNTIFVDGKISLEDGNIFSIDDENIIKEYKLLNNSYSYSRTGNDDHDTDEDTEFTHKWNLEEVEKLELKSLMIEELEMFPYEFKEEYNKEKDAIIVYTKVKLARIEVEELYNANNNKTYFDVLRNGISENILKMRFGKIIWSEHEEFIKLDIVLLEQSFDNNQDKINFLKPEIPNMMSILSYTKNLNSGLIDLLISKDLVTPEEINAIKEKASKSRKIAKRDFYEVQDIDTF